MSYGFHTISFAEINNQLKAAINWLKIFIPNVSPTRFGKYQKDIEHLISVLNKNQVHLLNKPVSSSSIMNSLYEADEIIQIYLGLRKYGQIDYLNKKLPIFIKGPLESKSEAKSVSAHQARDISFELFIASLFSFTSFIVDFSTESDLLISNKTYKVFIECKRPASNTSIRSNIKVASSQLKKRFNLYADGKNIYGLIFISIENVINPNHSLIHTSDEHELTRLLNSNMEAFITTNRQYWDKIEDKRIIGVIAFFKSFGIYENKRIPLYIRYAAANNIINRTENEINILKEIAIPINKQLATSSP
ncbi:MAG: hypothetical protein OEM46_03735 [Ignavibacteria bacterium]|nr:hypothetical protein [Ignavibacteria bacterium]